MNKKVLLRRPRCTINDSINYTSSPPKTAELEIRTTSFKDEIQPEIDILDQEYNINKCFENDSSELQIIKYISDIDDNKKYNDKRSQLISVWNIDENLLPEKNVKRIKQLNTVNKTTMPENMVDTFKGVNNLTKNIIQSEINCHNLYKQLEPSLPTTEKVVPKHIIIIQIAALLKRQLSDNMNQNIGCTIKKLPKGMSNSFQMCPKFEIILYDKDGIRDKNSIKPYEISEILQQKLLCTENEESFRMKEDEGDNDVSATDVSMMECHMTGKHRLQLKAHNISEIPKLINIFPNLTIIDISYNNFKVIPPEILELSYLEELNVRNNPLQMIPEQFSNMSYLRILICSFTRLSSVPISVFMCPNLIEMDLSYNNISCIPNIKSPNKLRSLDLSGNPIRYFKRSFGIFCLDKLCLENTLIHPLFWKTGLFEPQIVDKSWSFCDLCDQPVAEFSNTTLSFTRKFDHIIPILLTFCTTLCRETFNY